MQIKDGKVIVFHDDNLKRTTGVDAKIKNMSYNDLKSLRLQGIEQGIPLFEDVLKLINGKVPVIIIELK